MNVRRPFIVFALALLALAACRPGNPAGRYPGEGEPTPIPTVPAAAKPTFAVQRGDVTARIALNGRIAPVVEENLAFPMDGQVGEVLVAPGDAVAAGDLLATLDTAQLEQDRLVAQSELDIARARLAARQTEIGRALRRAELRRDMALLDYDFAVGQAGAAPSAAAQHEIDRLRLALELAQLDVEELDQTVDPALQVESDAAALRLEQIDAALAAAQIVAPFDGTILKVSKAAGRGVAAGETVIVLADVTALRAGAGATKVEVVRGPVEALREVTLTIASSLVTAVMGRNGSGKSTLLHTLAGQHRVTRGTVRLGAVDPATLPPEELVHLVGLVPQNPLDILYADSVARECHESDTEHAAPAGTTRSLLDEILPGVPDRAHPRDLSEGQQLALALAVVLVGRPPVVLLDEPTRGLDYSAKHALVATLQRLRDAGCAVVVATHDVELAAEVADRVILLGDGEVVADEAARELLAGSPAFSPQVARVAHPAPLLTVREAVAVLVSHV